MSGKALPKITRSNTIGSGFIPPSELSKLSEKKERRRGSGSTSSNKTTRSRSSNSLPSRRSNKTSSSSSRSSSPNKISRGVRARKRLIGLPQPADDSQEGEGIFLRSATN